MLLTTQKTACDGQCCYQPWLLKYKKSCNILSMCINRKNTYLYVNMYIYLYYMQIYKPVNLQDNFKHTHRCTHISTCMHASWPHCSYRLSLPPCTLPSISPPPNSKYNMKTIGTGHFKFIFVLCLLALPLLFVHFNPHSSLPFSTLPSPSSPIDRHLTEDPSIIRSIGIWVCSNREF